MPGLSIIEWRQLLLVGVFSFLFGVLLWSAHPYIFADKNFAIFIALSAVLIFVYSLFSGRFRWYLVMAVILLGLSVGLLRAGSADQKISDPGVLSLRQFEGQIVSEPDERENSQRVIVKVDNSPAKIMVNAPLFPKLAYGQLVKISGQPVLPENFTTDNGREFSYISFLKSKGVTYEMYRPELEILGQAPGFSLRRELFEAKGAFTESINKTVPEPNATLANGLLVGARRSLGEDTEDLFRKVGIIHIVVLSGYNVTIVAGSIMKGLSLFLPRYVGVVAGIISIILFALTVGADATVVRASIMAILAVVALALGRQSQIAFSLILAGFLMVFFNPFILAYDPGFQLSFLATLGLIYLAPIITAKLTFIPAKFGLREIAGVTIGTQIFVAPLLAYMSGVLSVVALPVNLLVLPAVPFTMLFSFLAGAFGLITTFLAWPFAFLTYLGTGYIFIISTIFGTFFPPEIKLPYIDIFLVILIYLGLGIYLLFKRRSFATIIPIKSN